MGTMAIEVYLWGGKSHLYRLNVVATLYESQLHYEINSG